MGIRHTYPFLLDDDEANVSKFLVGEPLRKPSVMGRSRDFEASGHCLHEISW